MSVLSNKLSALSYPRVKEYFILGLDSRDWTILALLLVLATLLRLLFYTGFFGSDEVVYLNRALDVLEGHWTGSDYVGSTRYGINIPMAGFMAVFGVSAHAANMWPLLCSLAEIALVFWLGRQIWDRRTAVLAALVITLLPLHIHFAGRLMGDAPLALFSTLSICALYAAGRYSNDALAYLVAGIALGLVYWTKEIVMPLVAVSFLLCALVGRRWSIRLMWSALGAIVVVLLNFALMWWIEGDPLHLLRVMSGAVDKNVVHSTRIYSPSYYFYYLLLDVRHTWLVGWVAVVGLILTLRKPRSDEALLVVIWWLGLLAVLSFTVISLDPFRWIPKQTNYMLLFVAPMCLLAGRALACMSDKWLTVILIPLVSGALLLGALEQQAIRVFTSNSQAVVDFAAAHPEASVYGSAHSSVIAQARTYAGEGQVNVIPVEKLTVSVVTHASSPVYLALDPETLSWGGYRGFLLQGVPDCWVSLGSIEPKGFGIGKDVLTVLRDGASLLPEVLGERILDFTQPFYIPAQAYLYQAMPNCRWDEV